MTTSWLTTKRIWQLIAFALGLAATACVFFLKIFTTSPELGSEALRQTAYEVAGPSVFFVIGIPLALTVLPLFMRGSAWVITSFIAAVGMILYTVTGIMSIGLLFLPAAIASIVGAFIQPPAANV